MNECKEKILKALSCVPLASTFQLGKLMGPSYSPRKKASLLLNQLLSDGLVQNKFHGQEKIWSLSKAGKRKMQTTTRMRSTNISHALAVADLYFVLQPDKFLFEPTHRFEHLGEEMVWEPDCIVLGQKDGKGFLWCVEVQLTPISRKRWKRKWDNYNAFFDPDLKHYHKASFQEWFPKKIKPEFVVVTNQSAEIVKTGFNISGRELIIKS